MKKEQNNNKNSLSKLNAPKIEVKIKYSTNSKTINECLLEVLKQKML